MKGTLDSAYPYNPDEWQFEMDNARLDLGYGTRKYQGVPLATVLESMSPNAQSTTVILTGHGGQRQELDLNQVLADRGIRIFNVTGEEGLQFAVAGVDGHIWVQDVAEIEVK